MKFELQVTKVFCHKFEKSLLTIRVVIVISVETKRRKRKSKVTSTRRENKSLTKEKKCHKSSLQVVNVKHGKIIENL